MSKKLLFVSILLTVMVIGISFNASADELKLENNNGTYFFAGFKLQNVEVQPTEEGLRLVSAELFFPSWADGNISIHNLDVDFNGFFITVEDILLEDFSYKGVGINGSAEITEEALIISNAALDLSEIGAGIVNSSDIRFNNRFSLLEDIEIGNVNIYFQNLIVSGSCSWQSQGLYFHEASLNYTDSELSFNVANLIISMDKRIISVDNFSVNNIEIAGFILNGNAGLTPEGIVTVGGYLDLSAYENGNISISVTIDTNGEIETVSSIGLEDINIEGFFISGEALITEDALLIPSAEILWANKSGTSLYAENIKLNETGLVSADEITINDLLIDGYIVSGTAGFSSEGITVENAVVDMSNNGGGVLEVSNLVFDSQGHIVSMESAGMTDVDIAGFTVTGTLSLDADGNKIINGTINLSPINGESASITNLVLDADNNVVSVNDFSIDNILVNGHNINGSASLNNQGLLIKNGSIVYKGTEFTVTNVLINSDSGIISADEIAINNLNIEGFMISGSASLVPEGILINSGSIDLSVVGSGSVSISNLLMNHEGNILSIDNFNLTQIDLNGFIINGNASFSSNGILIENGSVDLTPLNSESSVEITNLLFDNNGNIVSMDDFSTYLNIGGFDIIGSFRLNDSGFSAVYADIDLSPMGQGSVSIEELLIDNSGNIVSMQAFTLTNIDLNGFMVNGSVSLDKSGLMFTSASVDLSPLGSGSVSLTNLLVDNNGNVVSMDDFTVTNINAGGFVINGSARFDQNGIVLVNGLVDLAPVGGGSFSVSNIVFDHNGNIISADEIAVNNLVVDGFEFSGSASLIPEGLRINSGSINLNPLGGGLISVSNILIDDTGNIVSMDNFNISNLNIGGYKINGNASINSNGLLIENGEIDLSPVNGGSAVTVTNLLIDNSGNIVSMDDFSAYLNVGGYDVVGSFKLDKLGLTVVYASIDLAPIGQGTVELQELLIDGNGNILSMEALTVSNIDLNGFMVNGSVKLDKDGLIFVSANVDLTPIGSGFVSLENLVLDNNGEVVSMDDFTLSNIILGGFNINGSAKFDNNGITLVSGSIDLAPLGGGVFSVSNIVFDNNGNIVQADDISVSNLNVGGFIVSGSAGLTKDGILIKSGSVDMTAVNNGVVSISNLLLDNNGNVVSMDDFSLENINAADFIINGSAALTKEGVLLKNAEIDLSPLGGGTVSAENILFDSNGHIVYADEFAISDIMIGGFEINGTASLSDTGLGTINASIDLEPIGGGLASLNNLVIDGNGNVISMDELALNGLNVQGFIINASMTLTKDGMQMYSGSVDLSPLGSGSVSLTNLVVDGEGNIVSMDAFTLTNINIYGFIFSGTAKLDNQGLTFVNASLNLEPAGGGIIAVENVVISPEGELLSADELSITGLNIGGFIVNGVASLTQNGLTIVSADVDLSPIGGGTAGLNNLVIDSSGNIVSADNIYVSNLNIEGFTVSGNLAITKEGFVISGSVDLTPIGGGTAALTNLLVNGSGEIVSMNEFSITGLNVGGFVVNGAAAFNSESIKFTYAEINLEPIGGGMFNLSNLEISHTGEILSIDEVGVENINIGGFMVSASMQLTVQGVKLFNGSIDLTPLGGGSVSLTNLVVDGNGNVVSMDAFTLTNINVGGFVLNGEAKLDKLGITFVYANLNLEPIGGGTVYLNDLVIDGEGNITSIETVGVENINVGGFMVSASMQLTVDGIKLFNGSVDLTPLGGGVVSLSNLVVDGNGNVISMDSISLTNLNIGGYTLSGSFSLSKDGLSSINVSVNLAPLGGGEVFLNNLIIDSNGNVISVDAVGVSNLYVGGFGFSGSFQLAKDGANILNAQLDLTSIGAGIISVTDLVIDGSGHIVSITSFGVQNLDIGGFKFSGMASLNDSGITFSTVNVDMTSFGLGVFGVSNMLIDNQGNIVYVDDFYVNKLNIGGFEFSGSASFNKNGVVINNASLGLTPLGGGTAFVQNVVIDGNGHFVSISAIGIQQLNIGGFIVSGQGTLIENTGILISGSVDLSNLGNGAVGFTNLLIGMDGHVISMDEFSVSDITFGDFAVSGSARIDEAGFHISGSVNLTNIGSIGVTDLLLSPQGHVVSMAGADISMYLGSQFYIAGGAVITDHYIQVNGALQLPYYDMSGNAEVDIKFVKTEQPGTGLFNSDYKIAEAHGTIPGLNIGGYQLAGATVDFDQEGLSAFAAMEIPNIGGIDVRFSIGWYDGFRGAYLAVTGMNIPLGNTGLVLSGAGGGLYRFTSPYEYYKVILYGQISDATHTLQGNVTVTVQTDGVFQGIASLEVRDIAFGSAAIELSIPDQHFYAQAWLGEDPNVGLEWTVFSLRGDVFFMYNWPGFRIGGGGELALKLWFLGSVDAGAYLSANNALPPTEVLPRDGLSAGVRLSYWWFGTHYYIAGGRVLFSPFKAEFYEADDWPHYDIPWISGKSDNEAENNIPLVFRLDQNYPNPFNPTTEIKFVIPEKSDVELKIYNASGQLVKTLVNERFEPGIHKVMWDGTNDSDNHVSSGVYFYSLKSGSRENVKKMVLLK